MQDFSFCNRLSNRRLLKDKFPSTKKGHFPGLGTIDLYFLARSLKKQYTRTLSIVVFEASPTDKVTILNLGKDVCRWEFEMKFKTKDASRVFHLVTQFAGQNRPHFKML